MPYKPGQSGNPRGRPKWAKDGLDVRDLARKHTDFAMGVLVDVATNGKHENARVAAAQALLDRGWGKPPQSVEIGGEASLRIVLG